MKTLKPFKSRQRVEIIANECGHQFPIGTIVTIDEVCSKPFIDKDEGYIDGEYHAFDSMFDFWYIGHLDAVPINVTNKLYKYILK